MARQVIGLTIEIPDGEESLDMRVARALERAAGQVYINGAPKPSRPVRSYGLDEGRFTLVLTTLEASTSWAGWPTTTTCPHSSRR